MELPLTRLTIRSWRTDDAAALAPLADDYEVWRNLRDRFPHPYAVADAHEFITRALSREPQVNYAIALDGAPIGSIGIIPGEDIYRFSAEFGYWLGRPFWGRGFASEAILGFTDWAFAEWNFIRFNAFVFSWNTASARALERGGFTREATMKCAAVKEGRAADEWCYARLRPGAASGAVVHGA
ncbi:MAG: GNAT family N-acetyltransferase [Gemmatimonadaceae bacterium]|nr:GNAT family N-acetyltransferase [Gemmatimonadaceae bacterium]